MLLLDSYRPRSLRPVPPTQNTEFLCRIAGGYGHESTKNLLLAYKPTCKSRCRKASRMGSENADRSQYLRIPASSEKSSSMKLLLVIRRGSCLLCLSHSASQKSDKLRTGVNLAWNMPGQLPTTHILSQSSPRPGHLKNPSHTCEDTRPSLLGSSHRRVLTCVGR